MTRDYMEAAMAQATFEPLEDSDESYGRIPSCPGVWATGRTREECSRTLAEVLEGGILLGARFGAELPPVKPTTTEEAFLLRFPQKSGL